MIIRVKYERSYLVRRVQTWTADLEVNELDESMAEALQLGGYDAHLDELITDVAGDPDSEDYEDVDEWDIEGTSTIAPSLRDVITCLAAGEHQRGREHRWQECPTYAESSY